MNTLRYTSFIALLFASFCPVFAQKVVEYRWGESFWNNLDRAWEMPGGQLAATGSHLKSQDTLTEWKLLHLTTEGKVKAEFWLPGRPENIMPLGDGTTFFFESRFQTRLVRYRANTLTGKLLDSLVLSLPPQNNVFGTAAQAHPDGGWVAMYGTRDGSKGALRIVRFDPAGNMVFDKSVNTYFSGQVQTSHLLVLPSGRTCIAHENEFGDSELMCFNPAGFLLWKRPLAVKVGWGISQIVNLGNDRVAFAGNQSGYGDGYAVAFAAGGAVLWERKDFDAEVAGFGISRAFNDNGALILSGEYDPPSGLGMAVLKIAPDGKLLFTQKFLSLGSNPMVSGLLSNGNYFFAGFRWVPISGGFQSDKGYFLSLSPDGNLRWLLENDLLKANSIFDFCEMKDRGIALVGRTSGNTPPPPYVLQNLLFYLSPTVSATSPATVRHEIEVLPNPSADGMILLQSSTKTIVQVQVFKSDGQEVGRHWLGTNSSYIQLPAERGAYWLKVLTDDGLMQVLPAISQ